MKISPQEQQAIRIVLRAGADFGYGNMISHLQTEWARMLMQDYDMSESVARAGALGPGMPFKMQEDIVNRGEWDETGKSYQ